MGRRYSKRREIDHHERQEIIRLAQTDLTYVQIAKRMGRPLGTIVNVTNKAIHAGLLKSRREIHGAEEVW